MSEFNASFAAAFPSQPIKPEKPKFAVVPVVQAVSVPVGDRVKFGYSNNDEKAIYDRLPKYLQNGIDNSARLAYVYDAPKLTVFFPVLVQLNLAREALRTLSDEQIQTDGQDNKLNDKQKLLKASLNVLFTEDARKRLTRKYMTQLVEAARGNIQRDILLNDSKLIPPNTFRVSRFDNVKVVFRSIMAAIKFELLKNQPSRPGWDRELTRILDDYGSSSRKDETDPANFRDYLKDRSIQNPTATQRTHAVRRMLGVLNEVSQSVSEGRPVNPDALQGNSEADKYRNELKRLRNLPGSNFGWAQEEAITTLINRYSEMPSYNALERTRLKQKIDTILYRVPWTSKPPTALGTDQTLQSFFNDVRTGRETVIDEILMPRAWKLRNGTMQDVQNNGNLYLYGPPSTGKTSLVQDYGRAVGRPVVSINLDTLSSPDKMVGIEDYYVGAIQGAVMDALIKAGQNNPVLVLEELDKFATRVSSTQRGSVDPMNIINQMLDPTRRNEFRDNYLGIPYDLSNVEIVVTGNANIHNIPPAIQSKLSGVELKAYSVQQKSTIMDQRAAAIVEKRKEANALPVDFTIAPGAFMPLIRAAQNRGLGIREYEAAFGILLNNLEYKHAHGVAIPHQIDADTMKQLMEQIYSENLRIAKPINTTESVVGQIYTLSAMVNPEEMMDLGYGVVNQLNVTALPVLSSRGDKGPDRSKLSPDVIPYHISLAPELEDEKNEGTRIIFGKEKIGAFTMGLHWIKTHFANIPIIDPPEGFDLHITAGHGQLTPTEGFSAGGAQTAAMVSALTGIPIKGGLVSTGAINDQGDIIGIASLESKLGEAALRGATRAIIAKDNIDDYNRLPDVIKNQFKEVYAVDNIKQFLLLALDFNEDTLSKLSKVDLDQTRKFKAWLEEDKNYTDLSSPPPAERAKQRRGRKKAA